MNSLEDQYRMRYGVLTRLASNLGTDITEKLSELKRIDRISTRAKSIDRFVAKANKVTRDGNLKYDKPLHQIQDQIGARIITFYLKDVELVSECIEKYYRPIEQREVLPESEKEFGYTGKHYILLLPGDVFERDITSDMAPNCFELQIKTLFQHAWSEAEHDLGYKPEYPLTKEQKRRIAFTAAQAWGADHHFDSLHSETSNH